MVKQEWSIVVDFRVKKWIEFFFAKQCKSVSSWWWRGFEKTIALIYPWIQVDMRLRWNLAVCEEIKNKTNIFLFNIFYKLLIAVIRNYFSFIPIISMSLQEDWKTLLKSIKYHESGNINAIFFLLLFFFFLFRRENIFFSLLFFPHKQRI